MKMTFNVVLIKASVFANSVYFKGRQAEETNHNTEEKRASERVLLAVKIILKE